MTDNKRTSKLLSFKCNQCGTCCREPMVEITHRDLQRLAKHTGMSAHSLVRLYDNSELENDDCEEDWIKLSYGKRKIGLQRKKNGDCMFLSESSACTAYEARPISCRIFPVDVVLDDDNKVSDFELSDVVTKKSIACKHTYGKNGSSDKFKKTATQAMTETVSYWKVLRQWNSLDQKGRKAEFVDFLISKSHK